MVLQLFTNDSKHDREILLCLVSLHNGSMDVSQISLNFNLPSSSEQTFVFNAKVDLLQDSMF